LRLETQRTKPLDLRFDIAADQFHGEPGKGAVVDKRRIDADRKHGLLRHSPVPCEGEKPASANASAVNEFRTSRMW